MNPVADDDLGSLLVAETYPELVSVPPVKEKLRVNDEVEFGNRLDDFDDEGVIPDETPVPAGTVNVITAVLVRYVVDSASLEVDFDIESPVDEDMPAPVEVIPTEELSDDSVGDVETGREDEVSATKQEHAAEIRVGSPLHCETYKGRRVVAVLIVLVYLSQNGTASLED